MGVVKAQMHIVIYTSCSVSQHLRGADRYSMVDIEFFFALKAGVQSLTREKQHRTHLLRIYGYTL